MRALVSLRWSLALPGLILMVAGAGIVAMTSATGQLDYPTARAAAAYRCLVLLSPIVAAMCAWRSAELRRFLQSRPPVRRRHVALGRALWPLPLAAMLAALAALAISGAALPRGQQGIAMAATVFLALVSSAVLGCVAGQASPKAVAIPAVGVGLFLWHAVPAGTNPYWMRYANASFITCCTSEQQVATSVFRASIGLAGVWALGCVVLLASRLSDRGLRLAVAGVLVAGLAAGQLLAGPDPEPMAVQARSERPDCSQGEVVLCVWPEHSHAKQAQTKLMGEARRRLTAAGVSVPRAFSESALYPPGALRIEIAQGASESDQLFTVAINLLPNPQYCLDSAIPPDAGVSNIHGTYDETLYWLSRQVGLTATEMTERMGEAPVQDAEKILTAPPAKQQAWYAGNHRLLSTACRSRAN